MNCCYLCALREHCPHPESFKCECVDLGTCDGKRECVPCPEFKDAGAVERGAKEDQ